MSVCRAIALAALLGLAPAPAAMAQDAPTEEAAEDGETTEDGAEGGDAPAEARAVAQAAYDESLNRLGEISGARFRLDALCRPGREGVWRRHVEDFLAAQRLGEVRSGRLIASFNTGYRDYAALHRSCTPAAQELTRRFAREGAAITADLAARYGD